MNVRCFAVRSASADPPVGTAAPPPPAEGADGKVRVFDRNVGIPLLLRQLGYVKSLPAGTKERVPAVLPGGRASNLYREILELSYDVLPEDSIPAPVRSTSRAARRQAHLYYSGFTADEKKELVKE